MDIKELDLLACLHQEKTPNQRLLAEQSGYSLGTVNRCLRSLADAGYLGQELQLTDKARACLKAGKIKNAVILAAGFGLRMVPIHTETPKALLEVRGERLIERQIRQLHAAGVTRICVVVGFMKEKFEYLIDQFDVELIVNPCYTAKNNLYSLALAADYLQENCYIVPCDLWFAASPFHPHELYSWYMVSDAPDALSSVRVSRKKELLLASHGNGRQMVGLACILQAEGQKLTRKLQQLSHDPHLDGAFWEEALLDGSKMMTMAKIIPQDQVLEINTYEQLREADANSNQLQTDIISTLCTVFDTTPAQITNIELLKKGMTNRSFLFSVHQKRYIMRIPGEGTGKLIDRAQEAAVYQTISSAGIADDVIYMDPVSGQKITRYLEGARTCDISRPEDITRCMTRLRQFHSLNFSVSHTFDLYQTIEFYESLWNGIPSAYEDYARTKQHVYELRPFIESHLERKTLCHIDSVPTNFLFVPDTHGGESVRLIDWEYAAMQDPDVDLAMFAVYSLHDRKAVDTLIDCYYTEGCPHTTRIKIYCYIAVCGLLWSNWCEYKRHLGVEFGAYSLQQYRCAKIYFKLAQQEITRLEEDRYES